MSSTSSESKKYRHMFWCGCVFHTNKKTFLHLEYIFLVNDYWVIHYKVQCDIQVHQVIITIIIVVFYKHNTVKPDGIKDKFGLTDSERQVIKSGHTGYIDIITF